MRPLDELWRERPAGQAGIHSADTRYPRPVENRTSDMPPSGTTSALPHHAARLRAAPRFAASSLSDARPWP